MSDRKHRSRFEVGDQVTYSDEFPVSRRILGVGTVLEVPELSDTVRVWWGDVEGVGFNYISTEYRKHIQILTSLMEEDNNSRESR